MPPTTTTASSSQSHHGAPDDSSLWATGDAVAVGVTDGLGVAVSLAVTVTVRRSVAVRVAVWVASSELGSSELGSCDAVWVTLSEGSGPLVRDAVRLGLGTELVRVTLGREIEGEWVTSGRLLPPPQPATDVAAIRTTTPRPQARRT
jgi:hypothetical protein